MTIKDEILEELRKKTPLAEIQREYRSQSQLYEALREFLEEADKIVGEGRKRLEETEKELFEADANLKRVNNEKEEVSEKLEKLRQEKEKLNREIPTRSEELINLKAGITELQAKGFTLEILKKLKAIEDRSGADLLTQVETAEKYVQVEKGFSDLTNKKASLEEEIRLSETKKRHTQESVTSAKNELDELRLETATFKEAVAAVHSLFKEGYNTEHIKSLKNGLETFGIKGDPLRSVTRLVNGLKTQKTLVILEEKVDEAEKKLALLNAALTNAKNEFEVTKQETWKAVEEARNTSMKAIADTTEQANNATKKAAEKFEIQAMESLGKIEAHAQQTMAGIKTELGEWSKLQEEKGKLEESIFQGRVFQAILESDEYLQKIPLSLISRLVDRILLWSSIYLKDSSIKPSSRIHDQEYDLNTWHPYKIPVLIELVSEGIKQIIIKQAKMFKSSVGEGS